MDDFATLTMDTTRLRGQVWLQLIQLIDMHPHTKFHENWKQKNVDRPTDICTDGRHLEPCYIFPCMCLKNTKFHNIIIITSAVSFCSTDQFAVKTC